MEYGEAINAETFERALKLANALSSARPESPPEHIALEAVGRSYCACVTGGEDAAELRYSDVHRRLVEDVAARLEATPAERRRSPVQRQTPAAWSSPIKSLGRIE